MIALILIVLVALTTLFTTMQTLYTESMRLRSRELPAMEYFKEVLEPRLKMRTESGALTFSVWKHACLVAMGVLVLAGVIGPGPAAPFDVLEALLAALLLMNLSA